MIKMFTKKSLKTMKKQVLSELDISDINFIPVSALEGDNITKNSYNMPWYSGKPLMSLLEDCYCRKLRNAVFSLPVQYVNRPNLDFRGFCGTVSSGKLTSRRCYSMFLIQTKFKDQRDFHWRSKRNTACTSDAVTITLEREIDISRGDILLKHDVDNSNNSFLSSLIWFDSKALLSK